MDQENSVNTNENADDQKQNDPQSQVSKKSSLLGWLSLIALLLGAGILGYIGITVWNAYTSGNLGNVHVGFMLNLVGIILILSAVAFVLAIVTFFCRRQKKGLAILSLILSIFMLLAVGGVGYIYHSVFGSISHDEEFNELSDEELYISPNWQSEEIKFDVVPDEKLAREEVEQLMELNEIYWPYLDEADIPSHVYPYMYSQSPSSPCYLKPGAEKIENFILFGIDDNGLSDVIMVVSMDRIHQKIKLISIQRDSYVRIPGWGNYTKINHAYGSGKEQLSIATLNLNFKLNIKDYFTVYFSDVSAIVDIVGGVDVYLDDAEWSYMYRSGYTDLQVGANHLNGKQAVTYSRMRSSSINDNEVRRTGRQREVLNSLYASCKSAPISYYPDLVDTFTKLCKTSVDGQRILSMMIEAVSNGYTIENYALIDMVERWGGQFGPNSLWYFVYDLDAAGDILYRTIYEEYYVSGYPGNDKTEESAGSED